MIFLSDRNVKMWKTVLSGPFQFDADPDPASALKNNVSGSGSKTGSVPEFLSSRFTDFI